MGQIEPLQAPFDPEVQEQLEAMMPPGIAPIGLFRTFAKNMAMTKAMQPWGSYELSRGLSVGLREREIVIDRTCARCGCEYEWGVHVAFFSERGGLSWDQVASLTHGSHRDPCWETDRDRLLICLVDALHDHSSLPDPLFDELISNFEEAQVLDLTMLCGWYHAISFTARGARVPLEAGAPRFSTYSRMAQGK
jgi:alkylhydroperoxidase family enzyme